MANDPKNGGPAKDQKAAATKDDPKKEAPQGIVLDESAPLDEQISLLPKGLQEEIARLKKNEAAAIDSGALTILPTDYKVEAKEKGYVHAYIERMALSNGKRHSKPYVQKFNPSAWDNFLQHHHTQGYTIHGVLHLPRGAKKWKPGDKPLPEGVAQPKK